MNDDKKPPDSRPPRRDPYRLTGELFGGRYRLEEFAGMGSFGAVYRATDTRVGRTVAVKILKPDLGDDEMNDARELFQREALTAGRLMHPHIVAVTDVGEEAGFAYLVM
jgi:serine/threonine protein kinase